MYTSIITTCDFKLLLQLLVFIPSSQCFIYNVDDSHPLYEVVFDEEFLGGLALRCSGNKAYRLPPNCLINITYGQRWSRSRYTPRYSQPSSTPKDLKYSPRYQSSYSPENRDTAQQAHRQTASHEHYEQRNPSRVNKYSSKVMEGKNGSYSSRSSPLRQNIAQTPNRRRSAQSKEGGTDTTSRIKAIVQREPRKGEQCMGF